MAGNRQIPAAALAVGILLGTGSAEAQSTPVTKCGQVLDAPGQYHLPHDISDCSGNGVVITASDVHLVLAGSKISGAGCASGVGIVVSGDVSGVRIEGGTVQEFFDGIVLNMVSASRVNGMTVARTCDVGIAISNSHDVRIDTNIVAKNGLEGISLGASHDIVIDSNYIVYNVRAGVGISDFSDNNQVLTNILHDNGDDGVAVFNGNSNTVRGNATYRNGSGVRLTADGSSGNVAMDNTAIGNASTGIFIIAGGTLSDVQSNTAMSNRVFDMVDGNLECDSNTWRANVFRSDEAGGVPDGGPGAGCIR